MSHLPAGTDWLNTGEVRTVFAALEAVREDGSRFVGGCVRNTLMGRVVDDIDIATQLEPEETLNALEAAGIRAIPTGIEHGTVTAIVGHVPFEITSLRRDVETDGRRAVVAFTEDWAEDAQRRDFRLNAIYAAPDGKLYDPTGGGIEDAATGRVIFIGDADERLREDYLRILRFFRFNAWYGAEIDAEGLAACARQKDGLKQIAAERIWKEFKKLLGAPDPVPAVEAMARSGVLSRVLDQAEGVAVLHDLRVSETLLKRMPDPMQRLMALMVCDISFVERTASRLRLSNEERDRLLGWADPALKAPFGPSGRALRKTLYGFGAEAVTDRAMLSGEDARDIVAACGSWRRPVFPLKGEDLVKQGLSPGPAVGELLRTLEDWWVEGDFTAEKAELLEELERRLKAD